jgi:hypothetical protein
MTPDASIPGAQVFPACQIATGLLSVVLQLLLALSGWLCLVVKWRRETPRRAWTTWGRDVSKQVAEGLVTHSLNLALAFTLSRVQLHSDACAWYVALYFLSRAPRRKLTLRTAPHRYFINYLVDATIGLLLRYILLRGAERVANQQRLDEASCARAKGRTGLVYRLVVAMASTGEYGDPPSTFVWIAQVGVWIGVVVAAKAITVLLELTVVHPLAAVGLALMRPLRNSPRVELAIVMVLVPTVFNAAQMYVVDVILRSDTTVATRRIFGEATSRISKWGATATARLKFGGGAFDRFSGGSGDASRASADLEYGAGAAPASYGAGGSSAPGRGGVANNSGARAEKIVVVSAAATSAKKKKKKKKKKEREREKQKKGKATAAPNALRGGEEADRGGDGPAAEVDFLAGGAGELPPSPRPPLSVPVPRSPVSPHEAEQLDELANRLLSRRATAEEVGEAILMMAPPPRTVDTGLGVYAMYGGYGGGHSSSGESRAASPPPTASFSFVAPGGGGGGGGGDGGDPLLLPSLGEDDGAAVSVNMDRDRLQSAGSPGEMEL